MTLEHHSEETIRVMNLSDGSSNEPLETLQQQGWQVAYSFHDRIPDQWNMACQKVDEIQSTGHWKVLYATNQQDEGAFKDGVRYLMKQKTDLGRQWDKEHGIDVRIMKLEESTEI